jgi:MinD-like ATPase involved in chromosome partitioning or flagellar assembly
MRIGLLSTDERLIDELTNVIYREPLDWIIRSTPREMEMECTNSPYSYMVLSDRYLDFAGLAELLDILKKLSPTGKLIVMLSNYHEAAINEKYVKMCKMKQVDYVLPGHGVATITDYIRSWVDHTGQENNLSAADGKIISFVGSTPNIGTTLVSFGTAFCMAQLTNAKVGYLCLNLKSSKLHKYLGRDDRVFTLDALRAELKAQSLSKERLLQVCESVREVPGLYVLYGNMLREQAEFFTPAEIEHILRVARSAFDICVVEVNAYWDNAATICGIVEANTRIAVTTGDMAHFQEDLNKWIGHVGSVFGLQSHGFDMIAVQMDKQSKTDTLTIKDIRKETQMHLIGQVSRHADLTAVLNQGKLIELLQSSHPMQEEIAAITRKLIHLHQLTRSESESARKVSWFKKILAGTAVS